MSFSDIDGQTLSSALTSSSYTCIIGNCNFAMATAGGQVYGAQAQGGIYEHFALDGTFTAIPNLAAAGLRNNLGMWGNPVNGPIISDSTQGLVDIDPVAGTFRLINNVNSIDGVSVSSDGAVIYAENGGTVQSYNLVTGALIHTYSTGHSPDGTGVISGGPFDGDVIVNDNDGTVGLLDPAKPDGSPTQFVIIGSGGTRGDFVSPDTSNGTLFLSQNEEVARLSCGPGCFIGSTTCNPCSLRSRPFGDYRCPALTNVAGVVPAPNPNRDALSVSPERFVPVRGRDIRTLRAASHPCGFVAHHATDLNDRRESQLLESDSLHIPEVRRSFKAATGPPIMVSQDVKLL
jgi:hypothetical protein